MSLPRVVHHVLPPSRRSSEKFKIALNVLTKDRAASFGSGITGFDYSTLLFEITRGRRCEMGIHTASGVNQKLEEPHTWESDILFGEGYVLHGVACDREYNRFTLANCPSVGECL